MIKKKLLGGLALAPLAITACGGKNYDIIISAYGDEYLEADFKAALEKATGLSIKVVYHSSNEELERTMGSQKFDLVQASEYMVAKLGEANKLTKIDYANLGFTNKAEFEGKLELPTKSILSSVQIGSNDDVMDYMLPYTNGDLRFMLNKSKTACTTSLGVTSTSTTLDLSKLLSANVKNDCKIGIIDDSRVMAMIAANLNGATDATTANNPEINAALGAKIKEMKNAGITRVSDDSIALDYVQGKYDLVFTWNTTPLWAFEEGVTGVTADQTLSLSFSNNNFNNLWNDGTSITADANVEKAHKVLKAMYDLRLTSSAVNNIYNSPYEDVNRELIGSITNQAAFNLNTSTTHYGTFNYKKGTDREYGAKIDKLISDNWV